MDDKNKHVYLISFEVTNILSVTCNTAHSIAKLHLPLTLGRRKLWPKARNKHGVILKNDVLSLSATTRSSWNMASLLFRKGKGARGLPLLCNDM